MRKRSKSVRDLINRYLLSKGLLKKKLKRLYKVRLRHLMLLLLLRLSRSSQFLKQSYAANIAAAVVTLWGIELTNVLVVLVVRFLYIICMWLRNCDLKSIWRVIFRRGGRFGSVAGSVVNYVNHYIPLTNGRAYSGCTS